MDYIGWPGLPDIAKLETLLPLDIRSVSLILPGVSDCRRQSMRRVCLMAPFLTGHGTRCRGVLPIKKRARLPLRLNLGLLICQGPNVWRFDGTCR